MSDLKTRPTKASVGVFLRSIGDDQRRQDCLRILEVMKKATGAEPRMWGPSMVGFGSYHYKYESGREGDWFLTGFSPRKKELTLYVMAGFEPYGALMRKLGKYKTGKSCLYIRTLADIDLEVLQEIIERSVAHVSRLRL